MIHVNYFNDSVISIHYMRGIHVLVETKFIKKITYRDEGDTKYYINIQLEDVCIDGIMKMKDFAAIASVLPEDIFEEEKESDQEN